jgi:RHS repeat-associated protein
MTEGVARRHSLYSPELHLLAETAIATATSPAIEYEYVWFAGQPLAQISSTGAIDWYFNDHLGTPILQTDAEANLTWRVEYDPYGTVFATRTGADKHQPLRFPGQENDGSAELSYNIFRWYRSSFGRYTSPDPVTLGMLSGGTPPGEYGISFFGQRRLGAMRMMYPEWDHTYGYVAGNPLRAGDPKGLFGPGDLAGGGAAICLLDSPFPGPADLIGGVILVIAGAWALSEAIEHAHEGARDRTCRECDDTREKCKKRCDRAYEALVADCQRRFPTNPSARATCYAEAAEVYADCLRDCGGR